MREQLLKSYMQGSMDAYDTKRVALPDAVKAFNKAQYPVQRSYWDGYVDTLMGTVKENIFVEVM